MAGVNIGKVMQICRKPLVVRQRNGIPHNLSHQVRRIVTTENGGFMPQPKQVRFGLVGVIFTMTLGLAMGASMSQNVASFLEENDLFVPSDDDDDD